MTVEVVTDKDQYFVNPAHIVRMKLADNEIVLHLSNGDVAVLNRQALGNIDIQQHFNGIKELVRRSNN